MKVLDYFYEFLDFIYPKDRIPNNDACIDLKGELERSQARLKVSNIEKAGLEEELNESKLDVEHLENEYLKIRFKLDRTQKDLTEKVLGLEQMGQRVDELEKEKSWAETKLNEFVSNYQHVHFKILHLMSMLDHEKYTISENQIDIEEDIQLLSEAVDGIEGKIKDRDTILAWAKKKASESVPYEVVEKIFEYLPDAIMFTDKDMKVKYYSNNCNGYFGNRLQRNVKIENLVVSDYEEIRNGVALGKDYQKKIEYKDGMKLDTTIVTLKDEKKVFGYMVLLDKESKIKSVLGGINAAVKNLSNLTNIEIDPLVSGQ